MSTKQADYGPSILVALVGIIWMLGMIASELAPKQETKPIDLQPFFHWLITPIGQQGFVLLPFGSLLPLTSFYFSPVFLLTTSFWVIYFYWRIHNWRHRRY